MLYILRIYISLISLTVKGGKKGGLKLCPPSFLPLSFDKEVFFSQRRLIKNNKTEGIQLTFSKWISNRYGKENNQFSKLAELLSDTPGAPRQAKKKNIIKAYLVNQVVGPRMMKAFKEACRQYEKEMEETW